VLEPVETVTLPARLNPIKGSSVALTPEEIEEFRVAERRAFAERLSQRWKWNLSHL
jgi:hypothetical protein